MLINLVLGPSSKDWLSHNFRSSARITFHNFQLIENNFCSEDLPRRFLAIFPNKNDTMIDCFFRTLAYLRLRFFSIGYKKRIAIQLLILMLVAFLALKSFFFANLSELDIFNTNTSLTAGASGWDRWSVKMEKKGYRSIGDVFNQCEKESSRSKIGKVLINFDRSKGVVIATVVANFTMPVSSKKGTVHVIAQFLGRTLFDKKYNMCKVKVDTFKCPLKKGQKMRIFETFSLPKYIPKGKYKSYAKVYNQDNVCFTAAESELKV